jgi:hypothetical protein
MVEEEHSLNAPAYHGAKTRCVDAFNGKLFWDIYGICSWQSNAIADGYYTWLNYNDAMIYAMGPGPSATTVSAPNIGVPLGTGIEITGTVTDQTPQAQLKGTPAVSDQDQGKQMEFLIQHSIDQPNVQGVPVKLTAIDSAGKVIDLGTVWSDMNGVFSHFWTPPAVGEYKVVANFTGSQAYGPSSAATAIGVQAAPSAPSAAPVTPTPPPTAAVTPTLPPTIAPTPTVVPTVAPSPPATFPVSEAYVIAAALIVIIIVAIAALALRRRK